MKRKLLFVIGLCISIMTYGQIDFSVQTNGATASFTLTQQGIFYESIFWDFGDGMKSQGTNSTISHTYTTLGNYTVCVIGMPMPIATNDTMCKSVTVTSNTVVNCPWKAPVTIGVIKCENDISLATSPVNASIPTQSPQPTNVNWEWYSDEALTTKIASTSSSWYIPNTLQSQSYYVRYSAIEPSSGLVCWSPASKVTRTVNPKPTVNISATNTNVCYTSDIQTLTVSPIIGGTLSGIGAIGVNQFDPTTGGKVDGSYLLQYKVIDNNGCSDSANISMNVTYADAPVDPGQTTYLLSEIIANPVKQMPNIFANKGNGSGNFEWSKTINPFTALASANSSSYNTQVLTAAMNVPYYVHQTENGCTSDATVILLNIVYCPWQAPVVAGIEKCENDPTLASSALVATIPTQSLQQLDAAKVTWEWYADPSLSTNSKIAIATSSTFNTTNFLLTKYFVRYSAIEPSSGKVCWSPASPVVFSIFPKPYPQISSSVLSDYCYNDKAGVINISGSDTHSLAGTDLFKVTKNGVTTNAAVINIGTPTADINYDVEYVRTTNKQCKDSVKKTITVHYVPAPQVVTSAPTTIIGHNNPAPSATATLTASSLQWYDIDGFTPIPAPAGTEATYAYSGPEPTSDMVYLYKVLQIDNFGCKSAMTDAPMIFEICVAKSPIVQNQSICIYDTIPSFTITRSTVNSHNYEFEVYDMSPYSYPSQAKKIATISAGQVFTPVIPTVNAQIYKYWVAEHDIDDNCMGPGTELSLTVNQTKEPAVKVNSSICKNTTMHITLSVIPITGADVYWYDKKANTKEEALNASFINKGNPYLLLGINALPKGTYTYYASQIVNGCQSAKSAVTYSIVDPSEESVSVTINKGDSTLIGSIYYKTADTFDIHYNNELVCDSLVHYFISIKIIGDTNNNGTIDDTEIAGDIDGDGIINNGEICGDVNGNKIIDATEIAGDINGNGVIDNLETAGKTGIKNEIAGDLNGDGEITPPEIIGDINGNGTIDPQTEILGDINGNGIIDLNETTGIAILGKTNISVYPSPTKSMIYIKSNKAVKINKVEICSILGNIIQEGNLNSDTKGISIQSLPSGLYIIKIFTEGKIYSQKIIKE